MEDKLKKLAWLCNKLKAEQGIQAVIEQELADQKAKVRELENDLIPDYFNELGISELKLEDGSKVTVNNVYSGKVTHPSFYDWLRSTDQGDLIKNEYKMAFGKGEDDKATEIFNLLIKEGVAPDNKVYVHPSTLKANIKMWLEEGTSLPDSIEVSTFQQTKIKK